MNTKLVVVIVVAVTVMAIGAWAALDKMSDLRNQIDLQNGKLSEKDRELQKADISIGRLKGRLLDEKGLYEIAEDLLKARGGEWDKERRKYRWRIDSLITANADLEKKLNDIIGKGGIVIHTGDLTVADPSSSDALTQIKKILTNQGIKLGWKFDSGRVGIETDDVFAMPPKADVWTDQHFKVDAMVVRTKTGVKQGYVRLSEVDVDGKIISEAKDVDGDFNWKAQKFKWYDYILIGARAGTEVNGTSDIRLPMYGQIGYQSLGAIPWAVTIDPYVAMTGREDENFAFDYGAGLYFHIRKP